MPFDGSSESRAAIQRASSTGRAKTSSSRLRQATRPWPALSVIRSATDRACWDHWCAELCEFTTSVQGQRYAPSQQREVLVVRVQIEVMLDGVLRDGEVRNAHSVDSVAEAENLHLSQLVPVNSNRVLG